MTKTVMVCPTSALTGTYVVVVAPEIAVPSRRHSYESVTPTGAQVPGTAVSVELTTASPVMVTVPAVTAGCGTAVVEAEVTVVGR